MKPGRSKNIIAKGAHKLYPISSKLTTGKARGLSIANGVVNGIRSEKMKKDGKKESTWHKISPVILPTIAASPMLISEAAASRKGLSLLKKAGASKKVMKESRKKLSNAWGTYATAASSNIISGEGGRLIGKGIGKIIKSENNNIVNQNKINT